MNTGLRATAVIDLGTTADFRCGDLSVGPALRRIAGPAGDAVLEPRVMQLLVALAEAAGGVVPRDRLVELCWGAVVVGDDSLNRAIAGLRRGLKAVGSSLVEIETIPKVGYRLAVAEDAEGGAAGRAGGPGAGPGARTRRAVMLGGGLALAAGAGLYALAARRRPDPKVEALLTSAEQAARLADADAGRQGVGMLREAAALAPGNATVWGRLALALAAAAEFAPADAMTRLLGEARSASRRAQAIEPEQPDALLAETMLTPVFGNWLEAERRVLAILARTPDHVPSLDRLSLVWAGAGLIRAHYPVRLETVRRDPLHAGYNFRSIYAHWMNGDVAAADRAGARGLELWPRHFATWAARTDLFNFTGRPDRALAMLEQTDGRPDMPPQLLALQRAGSQALASGRPGDRQAAIDGILRFLERGGPFAAVSASMYLAALDAPDKALEASEAYLLERGPLTAGTAWQPGQLLHNDVRRRFTNYLFTPVMAQVRALPRFSIILRDIGLADFWIRSGARRERAARKDRLPDFD